MDLVDKTETKEVNFGSGMRTVTVVTSQLTKEEAREMFPYRPNNKYSESRFGGNTMTDDIALLLGGNAQGCGMCVAATRKQYLIKNACPDCDGRSEYNGTNPRKTANIKS